MLLTNITKQTDRAKAFFEDKLAFTLGPVELKEMLNNSDIQIVDVRNRDDYEKDHIPNAISIPGKDLDNFINKLSKDKTTIVYCYSQQCHLGAKTALRLAERGYPVMEMDGGYDAWKNIYGFNVKSGG